MPCKPRPPLVANKYPARTVEAARYWETTVYDCLDFDAIEPYRLSGETYRTTASRIRLELNLGAAR